MTTKITKLEGIESNLTDAISLYFHKRYLGSYNLAYSAYESLLGLLKIKMLQPILGDMEIIKGYEDLPNNAKYLWNKIKHANREQDDYLPPIEEDSRFIIHMALLEYLRLEKRLVAEHQAFIAWCTGCFPTQTTNKQFSEWAEKIFPDIGSLQFDEQLLQGLAVLSKLTPAIIS